MDFFPMFAKKKVFDMKMITVFTFKSRTMLVYKWILKIK